MVSFDKGRRCGAISTVEQEASAHATASAGTAPKARLTMPPTMIPLIRLCPKRLPVTNNS